MICFITKKGYILFIFLLIVFSSVSYAYIYSSLTVGDKAFCYDSGKIILPSICGDSVGIADVQIYAKYGTSNTTFKVNGTWGQYIINSMIPSCTGISSGGGGMTKKLTSFESYEGIFKNRGTYTIEIQYPEDKKIYITADCPGFKFSCSMVNLDIENCFNRNGYLYIIFGAGGLVQTGLSLSPYNNISYGISGNTYSWLNTLPANSIITNIETDKYQLKSFIGDNNTIRSASIKTTLCDIKEYPSTYSYKGCAEDNLSCANDEQCLYDEVCEQETKKCNVLECEKGKPKNHKCIECNSDRECDDYLVCTDDLCIDNKCVNKPTVCESEDLCMIGTCEEPTGCKYSIDEKCVQTKIFKGQSLENVQFIQILSEDEIQKELDNNHELKDEIEKTTGSNITPSYVKKVAMLMPEISRRIQFQRGLELEENRTIIQLKAKYLGDSKVEKLVIYDELPKSFAENASEINVITSYGGIVKIIKEDPSIAILYPTVEPLQELNIKYSVNKTLDVSILNQTKAPLVLVENIEGYNPNSLLYFYMILGVLFIGLISLGVYGMKKPKAIVIKKTIGGFSKEADKALVLNKVTLKHKTYKLLDNVSFSVRKETLCSIIGLSGSGKSMVIETIIGRKMPDDGYIEVFGKNTKTERQGINKMIGFVPQHPELYMNESVWKNMLNSGTKWSIKDVEKKSDAILKQLGLMEKKDLKACNLSGGQLKLLSLGTELLREPNILLLDEPTTGLDPSTRTKIMTILTNLVNEEGKTVIFSSHFMDEIEDCDQIIIINKGSLVVSDSPSSLKRRMPGEGKILVVSLNRISESLIEGIEKISGVDKVIRDGKVLRIISSSPDIVNFSKKIADIGGSISEIKLVESTMKDVFIYYTGEVPHE